MLTFLGILILFSALSLKLANSFMHNPPDFIKKFDWKLTGITSITGVAIILLGMSLFYSKPGYYYAIVKPTGGKYVITTEGFKLIIPFSKIHKWQKYIDVKVVSNENEDETDIKEVSGRMSPIGIRFIDNVTANSYVSVRFELPKDEEEFLSMFLKFRSQSNLVNNTLIPTVREQMINTAYMYSAQNYISGDAQSFRQTFDEQLKYGAYAVKKKEITDTIYSEIQKEDEPRAIKEIKTIYRVEKIRENGIPKRISHEITENSIIVSQVIVDKVDLEATFRKRLEKQRDESAKRQLEQQKIETAKASQQRILAEGERDKAQERAIREKEQVKELIQIETSLKKEETNKKLAQVKLETERLNAEALEVKKRAEANANRQLVNAGLTPQERAEWEYKTRVGVAEKIAGPNGLKLPENYIKSGDGKSGNGSKDDMLMLILLETMKGNSK